MPPRSPPRTILLVSTPKRRREFTAACLAKQLADRFGFEKVAITLRESHSAFDNGWSAMLYDAASREGLLSAARKQILAIPHRHFSRN